jgi:hypothetical protein
MSDERQAQLNALIDTLITEALDEHGDLAPPWARHPDLTTGSIGWRMGEGGCWLKMWWRWMGRQPTDRAWRLAYLQRHPPAPCPWQGLALSVFDPTFEDDGGTDVGDEVAEELEARHLALLHELEHAGVVGDDVAILAWLRLEDPPRPPWEGTSVPPSELLYHARRLSFFARWARRRREEGTLAPWLASVPAPGRAWRAFRDALADGQPPARLPRDRREQLAILLAAHGEPPPPWTRGQAPAALERRFKRRASYAGAWFEWAMESFDDATTWAGDHRAPARDRPA